MVLAEPNEDLLFNESRKAGRSVTGVRVVIFGMFHERIEA
jgi:hypothetical protein